MSAEAAPTIVQPRRGPWARLRAWMRDYLRARRHQQREPLAEIRPWARFEA